MNKEEVVKAYSQKLAEDPVLWPTEEELTPQLHWVRSAPNEEIRFVRIKYGREFDRRHRLRKAHLRWEKQK